MPSLHCVQVIRRFCSRPFSWSTFRGGCRFEPQHAGACKPGRYR